jgi:hypothetical protein
MANGNNQQGMGVGAAAAGLGAALAAAAGAYWLYGAKDAAKNRRLARSWMLKARADVMDQVEKLQNIDRKQYMALVDSAVAAAAGAAAATKPEVARLTRDLKAAWAHMSETMSKARGPAKKSAKKSTAKKAPKKAAKKGGKK